MMIGVGLIDDHTLLRKALAAQINLLQGYHVVLEASSGQDFMDCLPTRPLPEILFIDIVLPGMTGFDIALWTARNYPQVKVIALSMLCDESSVIRMLKNGARAFLTKDTDIHELENAMNQVLVNGIFLNRYFYDNFLQTVHDVPGEEEPDFKKAASLTAREKQFLVLLCADLAYKQIADVMHVSRRTVDGYRDSLLAKLKVASRIGLVTFAIRNHIVHL